MRRDKDKRSVEVNVIPPCDLCVDTLTPAYADARLPHHGMWANVCAKHFTKEGCELGTGKGQMYIKAGTERMGA